MSLLLTNMSHQRLRRGYMPVISCKGSALFRLDEKKARRFFILVLIYRWEGCNVLAS